MYFSSSISNSVFLIWEIFTAQSFTQTFKSAAKLTIIYFAVYSAVCDPTWAVPRTFGETGKVFLIL